MTPVSDFLPYIMPHTAGAIESVVEQAILDASIRFCRDTNIWLYDCDIEPIPAGEAEYVFPIPSGSHVAMPIHVWINGAEIAQIEPEKLSRLGITPSTSGNPRYYYGDGLTKITLAPIPNEQVTIQSRVALTPKRNATQVPDILANTYLEGIVSGALSRLFMMPNQPFTSADMAVFHAGVFKQAIQEAKLAAFTGHARIAMSVTPRAFGG